MPFVNIKIAGESPSKEQKERVIKGITDVLARELGKNPATTFVVIEEVPTDNWGIGGESVTERKKRTG
jgi:4-oxalocrotonate tautomerase